MIGRISRIGTVSSIGGPIPGATYRTHVGPPAPPPASLSLDSSFTDVTITDPQNGQELVFDGTKWINQ